MARKIVINVSRDETGNGMSIQLLKVGVWLSILIAPIMIWLQSTGYSMGDLRSGGLPGQSYYLLSKLVGLYAIIAMACQVLYGLSKQLPSSRLIPPWAVSRHRLLGVATLVLILLHAGLFILAVSIRKQEFAAGLLIPHFFKDFYHTMVSVGWLSLVIVLCVVAARVARNRLPFNWLWIHRLATPAIFLALLHALMIGSETRIGVLMYIYIALGMLIAWKAILRLRAVRL